MKAQYLTCAELVIRETEPRETHKVTTNIGEVIDVTVRWNGKAAEAVSSAQLIALSNGKAIASVSLSHF